MSTYIRYPYIPSGTVTSVGLTMPNIFSVSGSPVTSSGTLAVTLATEVANTVFAGPTTGADAAPTFRALVANDLPASAVTQTGTQALTNKDYDGGTASNTSRLTLPSNTLTNLNALTRKAATIAYNSTNNNLVIDDGTNLFQMIEKWNTTRSFTYGGFGTVTLETTVSKRILDTLHVKGVWKAGTTAASTAKINLPVTIDSTKYASTAVNRVGTFTQVRTAAGPTSDAIPFAIFYDGSDTAAVYISFQTGSNVFTKTNGSTLISTSDSASFEFYIAVSGW